MKTAAERGRLFIAVSHTTDGGAALFAERLKARLETRGHIVELVYLYAQSRTAGVDTHVEARCLLPHAPRGAFDYFCIAGRLWRRLRAFKPGSVYGTMPLGCLLVGALGLTIGCRRRIAGQHIVAEMLNPTMRWLDRWWGRLGIYTRIAAVSEAVARSLAVPPSAYGRRIIVVPNGACLRPVKETKAVSRAALGLPAGVPLVGQVGRLEEHKNQSFLLRIARDVPTIHLAFAGDGKARATLELIATDLKLAPRCHFLGAVPNESISSFLNALDVFAFPSKAEGMPLALIEALSAGLPVIASDIEPNREVLALPGGGYAGLILPLSDSHVWRNQLRQLLEDEALRARFAVAARARSRALGEEAMIDTYERLFFARFGVAPISRLP